MRTTATRKQTIATPLQRIPPILVKWTSLFLVLLVMMVTTFSGRLLPITRANPSHKNIAAVLPPGCPDATVPSDEVYTNFIGDACYYYKSLGCTSAYNQSSGNYCVAMNSKFQPGSKTDCPSVSGQTPKASQDNQTCFYFATNGFSSCVQPYTRYIIPDCTPALGQPGSGSPGNGDLFPGCPASPDPKVTNSLIYADHMKDRCYYDITLTGSCAGAYSQQSGSYCAADNSNFHSGPTNQCPPAPSSQALSAGGEATQTCFYFAPQGFNSCTGSYLIYEIPDCTPPPGSNGNNNPGGYPEGYPGGSNGNNNPGG
ncbi:MAG TPA: hypothetical protein VHV10_06635, partial [Ktedonobacteraceae bacterium]|nr:hypothetical protein [Ktedonobacteraceae bacterium]